MVSEQSPFGSCRMESALSRFRRIEIGLDLRTGREASQFVNAK